MRVGSARVRCLHIRPNPSFKVIELMVFFGFFSIGVFIGHLM